MAFFLFIDESGQDHHDSPYEVLAGIAIEDKYLWSFIINICGVLSRKHIYWNYTVLAENTAKELMR